MGSCKKRKTRLGDLLVERGYITLEQLRQAIQEQKASHWQLGKVLVHHGWVSKRQIRQALRIQSKLRNAILTSILSFSPLVLVGCGGAHNQVKSDEVAAEQQAAAPAKQINADHGATVHLSWDYPAERIDGSGFEIHEIDSFRVYQLDESGDVGTVHVVDGLETEYDIAGLDDGEYHFAVTVVDADGLESDYSKVLTVSVL